MSIELLVLALTAAAIFLWKYAYGTDSPKIKNLPEVPGLPFLGSLIAISDCPPRKALEWSKKYGPVFQIRLGNRRIVFANTFDSVRDLWIKNQSSLISRPKLYTFHSVISSSQGFTIGTSPCDASCKRRRRAAGTALNRPAVASYMSIVSYEAALSISELLADSQGGKINIDPNPYFQCFALNTSLTLNYGLRVSDRALTAEIIEVERIVSNFRSMSNSWQDYVPLLRLFGTTNKAATDVRARRDAYLEDLLVCLKDRIASGTDVPCITGNILKDPEAKLNYAEIQSICLTMVSAGLDTVPGNIIMSLAYLSSASNGLELQQRLYDELQTAYPMETLGTRPTNQSPTRVDRGHIYNGATIPAGSTFYMNTWAANYDASHFTDPESVDPERYMKRSDGTRTEHFSYGAGSRMCIGSHLANRELYVAFARLICAFEFGSPSKKEDAVRTLDSLECSMRPTTLTTDPWPFKVSLKVRDPKKLEQWIAQSEQQAREKGLV